VQYARSLLGGEFRLLNARIMQFAQITFETGGLECYVENQFQFGLLPIGIQ
jgi:hypothetical protein